MQAITGRLKRGLLCIGLVVAATAAVGAGSAGAAVTQTNVTSAGPSFGFGNRDFSPTDPRNERTVVGTSDGTAGTDQVDIRCEAPGTDVLLASGITVGTNGSFTATVHDTDFRGDLCRIIAVPATTHPTNLSTYTGPVVGNGDQSTSIDHSIRTDYFISQPQTGAYEDYLSLGSCGLCDSNLYASDLTPGALNLWFDNAAIYSGTYSAGATQYPNAQIDGTDVYDPDQANQHDSSLAGAPALTYTHTVDPATGDMEITERDPFVKCVMSGITCASYTSAGLELDRTILQNQSGRVVRITDVIKSTNGHAHSYSFAYDEDEDNDPPSHLEFQFPGDSGYKAYGGGSTGALNTSPVQTIKVIEDSNAAPSIDNPIGAITVSPAPTVARFGCPASTTNCDGFELVYTGTVPAGGSKTIGQYFGMGASQSEVDGYASANTAALTPSVSITSPAANGSTVHVASISVSGKVSASVTSLTVDGKSVAPNGGSWSTTVGLNKGSNTITAVATDGEGLSATATRTVTYTPIKTSIKLGKVKVKGTKLSAAVTCTAASGSKCAGSITLTVRERVKVKKHKTKVKTVTVGRKKYSLKPGRHTISLSLNKTGRRLLAKKKKLSATVTLRLGSKKVAHKKATFKAPKKKHKKHNK